MELSRPQHEKARVIMKRINSLYTRIEKNQKTMLELMVNLHSMIEPLREDIIKAQAGKGAYAARANGLRRFIKEQGLELPRGY